MCRVWGLIPPVIVVALPLAACAARDPYVAPTVPIASSGQWKIERTHDRITGGRISSASLITDQSSSTQVVFPQPAIMQLMCFKERPIVRLGFSFKVGSTRNASLAYRFDDKPGHETNARFVQDYRAAIIEDEVEIAKFIGDLVTSKTLYVRIRSVSYPRSSADFKVEGAPAAVEAAYANCPIVPPRTATPPTRRRVS